MYQISGAGIHYGSTGLTPEYGWSKSRSIFEVAVQHAADQIGRNLKGLSWRKEAKSFQHSSLNTSNKNDSFFFPG